MLKRHMKHLTDDQLLEAFVEPTGLDGCARAKADAHTSGCHWCAQRLADLETFLETLSGQAELSFGTTFSDKYLAVQREHIMRRLELAVGCRPAARILRFPAIARPVLATVHSTRRWLGAAAAAGLLVGIIIGQLVHWHPGPAIGIPQTVAPASSANRAPVAVGVSASSIADEEFIHELELVLSSLQVAGLVALDEITPRIHEVSINIP